MGSGNLAYSVPLPPIILNLQNIIIPWSVYLPVERLQLLNQWSFGELNLNPLDWNNETNILL